MATGSVTVTNVGDAGLYVPDITLQAPGSFTLSGDLSNTMLDPDESLDLSVTWSPLLKKVQYQFLQRHS